MRWLRLSRSGGQNRPVSCLEIGYELQVFWWVGWRRGGRFQRRPIIHMKASVFGVVLLFSCSKLAPYNRYLGNYPVDSDPQTLINVTSASRSTSLITIWACLVVRACLVVCFCLVICFCWVVRACLVVCCCLVVCFCLVFWACSSILGLLLSPGFKNKYSSRSLL